MSPAPGSVLILHGLHGSGPEHWQSWLAERLRARGIRVEYPGLPDPDAPVLERWLQAVEAAIDHLPSPPLVACHSLGSLLWLHLAARTKQELAERVLLVAPPSASGLPAEARGFVPVPLDPDPVAEAAATTRITCAPPGEDPYCPEGARPLYAEPLGLAVDEVAGGGHLNVDAGYGPWPAVERWCLGPASEPVGGRGHRVGSNREERSSR